MATPAAPASRGRRRMPQVAIARPDSPPAGPDSAQHVVPATDATSPAEDTPSVPTKRLRGPPVKKADKDKEKPKKGRGKDKAATEEEEAQETEYEDNGSDSDEATKRTAKKVVAATAAPKAGPSGSPNIAIASEALHAEWMAGYNLAIGTRQAAAEENKADAFAIWAEVGIQAHKYLALLNHDLQCTMEENSRMKRGQQMHEFRPPTPPQYPPFPLPYKSIWLSGTQVKTPVLGEVDAPMEASSSMLAGTPMVLPVINAVGDTTLVNDDDGDAGIVPKVLV